MKKSYGQHMLSPVGWLALSVLIAFLGAAVWYAVKVWTALSGVQMSGSGWASLVLGVVFTIGLGAGLMRLCFYSARHDMDH